MPTLSTSNELKTRRKQSILELYERFNHSFFVTQEFPSLTVARILAEAELLFSKHGYAGVSVRQITQAAEVNLAAVNYHFYDKSQLWLTLLTKRLRQVNHYRIRLLNEAEATSTTLPPPLPSILNALGRPLLAPTSGEYGLPTCRLVGRLLTERQEFASDLLRTEFQPTMTRFGQAIRRHIPQLPPVDFLWRLSLVAGALHHAAVVLPDMSFHTNGLCPDNDGERALKNFIAISSNALSA